MIVTHGTCGPIAWLIVGIYGVGWIIAFRKVKQ